MAYIQCYIAYKYVRVLVGIVHKRLFILIPRCENGEFSRRDM